MKKISLIKIMIVYLVFLTFKSNCQSTIDWQKCFGGSSLEPCFSGISNKIIKTTDNSYLILSTTKSNDGDVSNFSGDNYGDIWVVKIDSLGNKLWDKCLGGNNYDFPYSIKETNDSCILVMSTTASASIIGYHNSYDLLISKLNKNGTILWQKCFGGSGYDSDAKNNNGIYGEGNFSPQHWIERPNGNIIIVCETRSSDGDILGYHASSSNAQDIWLFEINISGNIVRQKCIGGSDFDIPVELILNNNNSEYFILGATNSSDGDISINYGEFDFAVFKIDSLFNIVWTKIIGVGSMEYPSSVLVENDGDILISGVFDGPASGLDGQIVVHKLDNDGNIIYSKNYGGSSSEGLDGWITPPVLHPTYDDGYIFGTTSYSDDGDVGINYGMSDYWLVKIDSSGNIIWDKVLGTLIAEYSFIILHTKPNGEIFVTIGVVAGASGNLSNPNYHGGYDLGNFKFDSNGNLLLYNCMGGSGMDLPQDIYYDFDLNSYFVLGYTSSNDGDVNLNHGSTDIWVLKLNENILSLEPNIKLENNFLIYPNPTVDNFTIDIKNANYTFPINLEIINSFGVRLQSIKLEKESNSIELGAKYSPGIYFIRFSDYFGNTISNSKLIKQ